MKTTTKKLSDTKLELTVTLDAKDLAKARQKALQRLAADVEAKGFRKGKVPLDVAEKLINPNELNSHTADIAVRETVMGAFQEAEKSPLVVPNVNVTKFVPDETLEYTATADIVPEVKVGDFKNLGVKKPEAKVAAKDVQEILDNIAQSRAEKSVVQRAAKLGDEVVLDFTGKKDGKPFDGGRGKDFPLTLGSGQFIPGFEDGIVGHEVGDKFDLPLTFPKEYHAEQLAGQKVVFEVLVKQINEIKKPKIDDEFAKGCGPFKTLAELKEDIKKNLAAQNEQRLMNKYQDDLVNALVKKSKVAAPEILINDQLRLIRDDMERNVASHGMKFEDFLGQIKQTEEEWTAEAKKVAEARVKASLVLQVLANEQKISASDEAVAAKLAELRDVYQKAPDALKQLKDPRVRQDIKNRLTIEQTLDFLVKAQDPAKK